MTHWSFLGDEEAIDVERLCGIPFVIADADARKDKKHAILEQNLGERYHKLKCREIENLIEPSVLKELVGRRDPSYANDIDKPTRSAYRTARLGSFIEDKMLGPKRPPRRSYKSKTGSIAQKAKFADECIALTKSTSDMSQAAIDLTEEIIEFVRKKNSPAEST